MVLSGLLAFLGGFMGMLLGARFLKSRKNEEMANSMGDIALLKSKIADRELTIEAREQKIKQLENTEKIHIETESSLREKNKILESRLEEIKLKLEKQEEVEETNRQLQVENRGLKVENEKQKEHIKTLNDSISTMKEEIKNQFTSISHDVLKVQKEDFEKQQKESLGAILNPLNLQIKDFKNRMEEVNKNNIESESKLKQNIEDLIKHTQDIGSKADNLANALKNDKKAQGNWGEMKLKNLLDSAGLSRDVDYYTQVERKDSDGNRYYLDLVLKLADGKNLIIDSKVSMINYENYLAAKDADEKRAFMKSYCMDIKKHIEELGKKKYHELYGDGVDFVCMFLPLEMACFEAINFDNSLFTTALQQHIAMVTPSSLMPVIYMISHLWNIAKQNKHTAEIVALATRLYEKLSRFVVNMNVLKQNLEKAEQAYDKAMNVLSRGKGNAIKTANDIKDKLGGNAKIESVILADYDDLEEDTETTVIVEPDAMTAIEE